MDLTEPFHGAEIETHLKQFEWEQCSRRNRQRYVNVWGGILPLGSQHGKYLTIHGTPHRYHIHSVSLWFTLLKSVTKLDHVSQKWTWVDQNVLEKTLKDSVHAHVLEWTRVCQNVPEYKSAHQTAKKWTRVFKSEAKRGFVWCSCSSIVSIKVYLTRTIIPECTWICTRKWSKVNKCGFVYCSCKRY